MNGMTAFIDPRYKQRSFAESKLAEIIPQCWIYDPNQRIDIFQLVNLLRIANEVNKLYENITMIKS
jgi:Uma2 family endonuclease